MQDNSLDWDWLDGSGIGLKSAAYSDNQSKDEIKILNKNRLKLYLFIRKCKY
jgi:hypothetical protein